MPLDIPNIFVEGTKAKAPEVNENFDAIANLFNVTGIDLDEYGVPGSFTTDLFSEETLNDLDIGPSRRGYAQVLTQQQTSSTTFANLTTVGPQVTVEVPSDGLVFVLAEVEGNSDGSDPGEVAIQEATDIAAAKAILTTGGDAIFRRAWTTPGDAQGTFERTEAGFLVFPATAGTRTYKLMYRIGTEGAGGGTVAFKNRKLWVATMGNFT